MMTRNQTIAATNTAATAATAAADTSNATASIITPDTSGNNNTKIVYTSMFDRWAEPL